MTGQELIDELIQLTNEERALPIVLDSGPFGFVEIKRIVQTHRSTEDDRRVMALTGIGEGE